MKTPINFNLLPHDLENEDPLFEWFAIGKQNSPTIYGPFPAEHTADRFVAEQPAGEKWRSFRCERGTMTDDYRIRVSEIYAVHGFPFPID